MIPRGIEGYRSLFSDYTELRFQENRAVNIVLVDGEVLGNNRSEASGVSARVYRGGSWGFASHPDLAAESVKAVVQAAADNARFMDSRLKKGAGPLPREPGRAEMDFSTKKPRLDQKGLMEFLKDLDAEIVRGCPGLTSRTVALSCLDMEKSFIGSDGSLSYSMVPRAIIYVTMAMERDGVPYDLYDVYGGRGQFEDVFQDPAALHPRLAVQREDLAGKAAGVHAEAGQKECILDSDLAGVLAHEAVGHTTEADIVRGGSIAGERLDTEVASPLVTMVDFAYEALGSTCPVPVRVDDEGTQARDALLIERGVLRGFMHNKESAVHFHARPTGNARAYRFSDEPLIRMRNTAILPGEGDLGEMIASIDDGYYLKRFNNGQADSTSEFMFGIVLGYEIKGGRLGRGIRDTTISGVAFEMLKTVSMVSRDMHWSCSGMCGKKQSIPVGMGGPAIKCRVSMGGR